MDKKTQPTKTPDVANSKMITVEWWLKLVALIGVTVSLLGYGVVTGLASAINLDHGSILSGPFDLQSLVWPGVVILLTSRNKIYFALVLFVVIGLPSVFMHYKDRLHKLDWICFKEKVLPGEHETVRTTFQKAVFFAISCLPKFTTLVTLFGYFVIFGIILFFLIVPLIGFSAGQAYFNEYILKPKHCASIVPGDILLKDKKMPILKSK